MSEVINYKGRVWTCDEHNKIIEECLNEGMKKTALAIVKSLHPKKGNSCKECARSYDETPPCNR
jgi:hypothetical protein